MEPLLASFQVDPLALIVVVVLRAAFGLLFSSAVFCFVLSIEFGFGAFCLTRADVEDMCEEYVHAVSVRRIKSQLL